MDEEPSGESKKPININHERAKKEFPALEESERNDKINEGEALVTKYSLAAENGVFWNIENQEAKSTDLNEQIQNAFLEGAATELTKAVFGESGPRKSAHEDSEKWKERFNTEFDYLSDLTQDRTKINAEDRIYPDMQSATIDMTRKLEYAEWLIENKKGKEKEEYLNRVASDKALENLGLTTVTSSKYSDLLEAREVKEKKYYEDALEKHISGHGKKDTTYIS